MGITETDIRLFEEKLIEKIAGEVKLSTEEIKHLCGCEGRLVGTDGLDVARLVGAVVSHKLTDVEQQEFEVVTLVFIVNGQCYGIYYLNYIDGFGHNIYPPQTATPFDSQVVGLSNF